MTVKLHGLTSFNKTEYGKLLHTAFPRKNNFSKFLIDKQKQTKRARLKVFALQLYLTNAN